jgi:hypothetical protein
MSVELYVIMGECAFQAERLRQRDNTAFFRCTASESDRLRCKHWRRSWNACAVKGNLPPGWEPVFRFPRLEKLPVLGRQLDLDKFEGRTP